MTLRLLLAASLAVAVAGCSRAAERPMAGVPDVVDFNFHVRPVLSDRCFKCHGPDDKARKAGLRLDIRESALARLESGRRAVVPGDPDGSELVRRIYSRDPKVMMPAPESHLSLTDVERGILARWIEQGAEWKPHWAFIPPAPVAVPRVGHDAWAHNEIDRFVLAALESRGMAPSPEADRATLIRRVSFDLTGLPPTIAEVDAFLADRSPGAYERVVDRLLASPAYGERMAVEWLDLARYADSHGYQDDGMRDMWPWRDWVIDAFNRNMPFDQFVTWQLAGDLLPGATDDQRLATGFNRHHMQSQEGGVVPEEYRTEYVADRVNTLGRAFLGVSVECARCHDHKYDPVSQKEYFQLFSFFNNNNETGQIPYSGIPSPTVVVMDAGTRATVDALRAEIAAVEAGVAPEGDLFERRFANWLADNKLVPKGSDPRDEGWDEGVRPQGRTEGRTAGRPTPTARPERPTPTPLPRPIAHVPLDASSIVVEYPRKVPDDPKTVERREVVVYSNAADPAQRATAGGDKDRRPQTVPGRIGSAQRLPGDSYINVGKEFAFFERNQPFSLGVWVRLDKPGLAGPLVTRSGGLFNGNRGYEIILHPDGTLTAGLHHVFPDNSIEVEAKRALTDAEWHHVGLTYDGSSRAAGLRLFLDGAPADRRVRVDNLRRSIIYAKDKGTWGDLPPLRLGKRHDETIEGVAFDDLRVYDDQLSALEMSALAAGASSAADAIARAAASDADPDRARLREHFHLRLDPERRRTLPKLTALRGRENEILTAQTEVMTMREMPEPRPTFVLARGAYDAPTVPVTAGTPQALGPFPADLPANRLGLARWLLAPSHPLTARVAVNRYWAMFFGRGIVPSLADFGSQGRLPSHPQLLDWLALRLVQSKWDLKALHRLIVTSAAYRQTSTADAQAREADPENQWIARGPSHRLAAEQIRDAALAASGLLVRRIGGPSVYPYQPPGLWEALATRNATTYVVGKGDDLYRRGLYTVWKRSSPPPSATSFDAAERLFCTVSRQRTSTPLQALVLLNDPQYVEAARKVGERMLVEGGATAAARVTFAFRLITGRTPSDRERALLEQLYADQRAAFTAAPAAARKLLATGESPWNRRLPADDLAAASVVATTVMNADEAVMKR